MLISVTYMTIWLVGNSHYHICSVSVTCVMAAKMYLLVFTFANSGHDCLVYFHNANYI